MLDLLSERDTERTAGERTAQAAAFPPELLAFAGIQATRWSLQQADRNEGRRNLWLRSPRPGSGWASTPEPHKPWMRSPLRL